MKPTVVKRGNFWSVLHWGAVTHCRTKAEADELRDELAAKHDADGRPKP